LAVAIASRRQLPQNLRELEKASGWSVRTLRADCQAVGITTKTLLDFVWCLKVVCVREGNWDPRLALMDYKRDPRTIERLIVTARLTSRSRPSVRHFIYHQCFITSGSLRDAICSALRRRRRAA
jgi:hypothetical protein